MVVILLCELYGIVGNNKININKTLSLFYKHSDKNPHGWGLAYLDDNDISQTIYKEAVCANESKILPKLFKKPIETKVAIGHIRFATIGKITKVNCHPFSINDCTGRQWTLAHNGNIYSGLKLISYTKTQIGQTDSERVLLHIIENIDKATNEKGAELSATERCKLVDISISELSYRNKLNLLIYDSELFYVHTNIKDTLYYSLQEDHYCFVTVPLENNFEWSKVPLNKLNVYLGIDRVYLGEDHGNEFINAKPGNYDKFYI